MNEKNKIESMASVYEKYQNRASRKEGVFYKKIRNTLYTVDVFSDEKGEASSEKIFRIIKNKIETKGGACGIISLPQMSQPQEGGSDEQLKAD